jgi:hypothetical protein
MATTGESWAKLKETRQRLEKCWQIDINWSLYPATLKEVCPHDVANALIVLYDLLDSLGLILVAL